MAAAFIDNQFTALLIEVALGEDPDELRAKSRVTFTGLTALATDHERADDHA